MNIPSVIALVTGAARNKNEGTELFKGGVYKQAAIRYTKALQNCTKFFDLSEADEKEVNEIKVKLHLNIAMCFLKPPVVAVAVVSLLLKQIQ